MKTVWKCAVLATALALSSPQAFAYVVQQKVSSPVYLVDLKEAKLTDVFQARKGSSIYEQEFLPHSMVKIDQDLIIPFVTLSGGTGKSEPTIYPAGSVLVEAYYADRKVYCNVLKQKPRNWVTSEIPLGICLSDADKSGKFTKVYYFRTFTYLEQGNAYQVLQLVTTKDDVANADINVAYEDLPVDEAYASKLTIIYDPPGIFEKDPQWTPNITFAATLTLGGHDGWGVANLIGRLNHVVTNPYDFTQGYAPGTVEPLQFGRSISVAFKPQDPAQDSGQDSIPKQGGWALAWQKSLPAGEYFLHTMSTSNVYGFAPAPPQYANPVSGTP